MLNKRTEFELWLAEVLNALGLAVFWAVVVAGGVAGGELEGMMAEQYAVVSVKNAADW